MTTVEDQTPNLPIEEAYTPDTSTRMRRFMYDPFSSERAEMRGSTDRMERVCAWIAGCWPEATARAIEKVSAPEFEEWIIDHREIYDRGYEIARGMLIAEMRAAGLGISNRRNQKAMAISVARMMGFKDLTITQWDARKGNDEDQEPAGLGDLTPEEVAELAALED